MCVPCFLSDTVVRWPCAGTAFAWRLPLSSHLLQTGTGHAGVKGSIPGPPGARHGASCMETPAVRKAPCGARALFCCQTGSERFPDTESTHPCAACEAVAHSRVGTYLLWESSVSKGTSSSPFLGLFDQLVCIFASCQRGIDPQHVAPVWFGGHTSLWGQSVYSGRTNSWGGCAL